MRVLGVLTALLVSTASSLAIGQAPGGSAGVPIFDGRSFDGWEGDRTIFRIEDGAIVGGSLKNKVPRNEFLCTTRTYSDFELRLKVKLLGGEAANAGVQFRSRRIPGNHEVIGYQADLGQNYWGSLYDESRRNRTLMAPSPESIRGLIAAGDWNEYLIRAQGKRIQLWLNGVQTVDYTEQDPTVDSFGVIGLQIHSGPPSEAWYKDITLRDMTR
jgi:hypothetical protein